MIEGAQSAFSTAFGRLSTGAKLLAITAAGLVPLGALAVSASLDTVQQSRDAHRAEVRQLAAHNAGTVAGAIERRAAILTAAAVAAERSDDPAATCEAVLPTLARREPTARLALLSGGTLLCGTDGFAPAAANFTLEPGRIEAAVDEEADAIRYRVASEGGLLGVGLLSRGGIARELGRAGASGPFEVLVGKDGQQLLAAAAPAGAGALEPRTATAPVGVDDLQVTTTLYDASDAPSETLSVLLPILMVVASGLIGWLIVDRLLIRPLRATERAVAGYQPGGSARFEPVPVNSPARELRALGAAFSRATGTIAAHEAELEAGLERQRSLVREVHHRVKNNLQVVASLLNLHARGAKSADAAEAYAAILRRVDALAVVHRNHFAELEENHGIAIRSLVSELAQNLRGTAPPAAAGMAISVDLASCQVSQDTAVSVAFLLTEIIEFSMLHAPGAPIGVRLTPAEPGKAELCVSTGIRPYRPPADDSARVPFERISTGVSRQLRAKLVQVPEEGEFRIQIAVLRCEGEAPEAKRDRA